MNESENYAEFLAAVRRFTKAFMTITPMDQPKAKSEYTFQCSGVAVPAPKPIPAFCNRDAGLKLLTPLEETIQRLMDPDKNGNAGRPIRSVAMESFGHIENRTLDALWKFAEGTAAADRENKDFEAQLEDRAKEAESQLATLRKAMREAPGRGQAMREALGIPLDTPIEQVVETAHRIRMEADRVVKIHDLGLLGHKCDSRAIDYLRAALAMKEKP